MTNKHRFSKIHAYSPHTLANSIHPYYIRAESEFNLDDITAITFVTHNRLEELVKLAELWKGNNNIIYSFISLLKIQLSFINLFFSFL